MRQSPGRTEVARSPEGPTVGVGNHWGLVALFASLAIAGAILDLATKHWVFQWRGNPRQNNEWWIIEGFFGIETSLNNGALFGMGQGMQWLFASLSIAALIGIIAWLYFNGTDRFLTIVLGMISAGIIGNLVDRLGMGKLAGTPDAYENAVRDWILFRFGSYTWPNFNLADSFLVCGAILLMGHAIWFDSPSASEQNS